MAVKSDKKEEVTEEGTKVLKVKAFTGNYKSSSDKTSAETRPAEDKQKREEKEDESKKESPEEKSTDTESSDEVKEDSEAKSEESKTDVEAPAVVSSFSQLDQEEKPATTESSDEVKEEGDKKIEPEKVTEAMEVPSDDVEKHKVSSDEVKKWLSDSHGEETKEIEKKRGINFKALFLVFLILALIAVIVGGVYYYRSRIPALSETAESEIQVQRVDDITPTETPTPTPDEELDVSEYTLQILNGSGIPGEAGIAETLLTDIEFSDVTRANADAYDYTDTEVAMKEDVPEAVYELVSDALEGSYTVARNEDVLDEDSEYDVIIIVGVKK